jgi:hypothetical protein
VDLLQSEIYEVDGVIVEEIRRIYQADIEESGDVAHTDDVHIADEVRIADNAGAAGASDA